MMKPAVLYLRRSTDRQDQSLPDQRRALERFAAERSFSIITEYVDDAVSGAETQARKAFLKLIDDAKQDPRRRGWNHVLVYDVSRFGRVGNDEAGYFRHMLSQHGVEVHYASEGLRGDDTDDLLLATKTWVAHRMVVDLSKVTIRGQISKVDSGKWCGGRPPFGYDLEYRDAVGRLVQVVRFLDDGTREIRDGDGVVRQLVAKGDPLPGAGTKDVRLIPSAPERVATVRRIFEAYAIRSKGFGSVAAELNDDGVRAASGGIAKGGLWSASSVKSLLGNPHYRGDTVWNRMTFAKFHRIADGAAKARSKVEQGKVARNPKESWIVVRGTHEPLVPPELFDRAQRLAAMRGGLTAEELQTSKRNSPFVLSGLLVCARCGAKWQGRTVHKGRRRKDRPSTTKTLSYVCGSYVRKGAAACGCVSFLKAEMEADVIAAAVAHVKEFAESGGAAVLAALAAQRATPVGVEPVERLEERLAIVEKRIAELVDCLTPALAPVIEGKIATLRQDADLIRGQIEERRATAIDEETAAALVRDLAASAGGIEKALAAASPIELREVLRGLVREIRVDAEGDQATVSLFALPRVDAMRGDGAVGARSTNEETTVGSPRSSHCLMAGARFIVRETTFRTPRRSSFARKAA